MGKLAELLGPRVYLDTNIIIYIVEGFDLHATVLKELLAALDANEIVAITSELTVAEVLVKPLKDKNETAITAYRKFLRPSAALHTSPVTRLILEAAAAMRATTNVTLADAIHLASCVSQGCDSFLTNDESLKTVASVNLKLLSDLRRSPAPPQ
jgi:predicted nucleic acid-binding protein